VEKVTKLPRKALKTNLTRALNAKKQLTKVAVSKPNREVTVHH